MNIALAVEAQKTHRARWIEKNLKFRSDFDRSKLETILRLLDEKNTQHDVARMTNTSPNTIKRIFEFCRLG